MLWSDVLRISFPGPMEKEFAMKFESYFDLETRLEDIDRMFDPLALLVQEIDRKALRPFLMKLENERMSNAPRNHKPVIMCPLCGLQNEFAKPKPNEIFWSIASSSCY
jgi:hypothetical protein